MGYYESIGTGYDTGSETLPTDPDYAEIIAEEAQLDGLNAEDAAAEGEYAAQTGGRRISH